MREEIGLEQISTTAKVGSSVLLSFHGTFNQGIVPTGPVLRKLIILYLKVAFLFYHFERFVMEFTVLQDIDCCKKLSLHAKAFYSGMFSKMLTRKNTHWAETKRISLQGEKSFIFINVSRKDLIVANETRRNCAVRGRNKTKIFFFQKSYKKSNRIFCHACFKYQSKMLTCNSYIWVTWYLANTT